MTPRFVGDVVGRVLLNYRVEVEELESVLPEAFHPVEVDDGVGIGGVCASALQDLHPNVAPDALGLSTVNTSHRIAVVWKEGDDVHRGSYVNRQDVGGRLKALAGSAVLPGVVRPARITVDVDADRGRYYVRADCRDEFVRLRAEESNTLDGESMFSRPGDVLEVYEDEEVAYAGSPGSFEAVESCCVDSELRPLKVEKARSSFFEKLGGEFDSALALVEGEHEITGKDRLKAP